MKHIRKCILDIALCVVFLGSIWIPSIAVENKQITSESSVLVPTYRAIPSPAADSSWTTLYAETFATDTGWDLAPSSGDEWISTFAPVTEIAYVRSNYPTTNYGSDIYIYEEYFNFESQSYLAKPVMPTTYYLTANSSNTQLFHAYWLNAQAATKVYETTIFDENTITWNTKPPAGGYINYCWGVGWQTIGAVFPAYFILLSTDYYTMSRAYSDDYADPAYRPYMEFYTSKQMFSAGSFAIQTDITETLMLDSPTFSTLNLRPTDEIRVTYNTTSTHQINVTTNFNGVMVSTQELVPEENSVFTTQTKTFTLAEGETINGLSFTGTFDDTQYLNISSIEIAGDRVLPELELVHPSAGADLTLLQLAERIFGNAAAPGIEWGIGNIPAIKATAWDGESAVKDVIASIAGNEFALGHPTWDGALPSDYELSAYGGQWEEWNSFWNATDVGGQSLRGQGVYDLTVTARDLAELEKSASISIYRDLSPPDLVVSGIANGTGHASSPSVTVNIMDEIVGDLPGDYTWGVYGAGYTFHVVDGSNPLDAGWEGCSASPLPLPGGPLVVTLNETAWAELPEGPVTVTFMVLDFGGNVALKSFAIIKDTTVPIVQVTAPSTNTQCNAIVPSFSLSVTEANIASVQYAFGGSSSDWHEISWTAGSSVSTIQQSFDASAWGTLIASTPEVDNVVIKFKVTDLAGQAVVSSVNVNIDALAPRLKLLNPESGTKATAEAPSFLFESITDPNLAQVYYTLSGSDTKYYVTVGTLSGQIDQAAWDLALNKTITIKFWAVDSFGNEAVLETTVTRTDYIGPGDDPNPGFSNFFEASPEVWAILGGVGAVTLTILAAYYRALKKRVPKIPPEELIRARMDEQNGGSPA